MYNKIQNNTWINKSAHLGVPLEKHLEEDRLNRTKIVLTILKMV